ncbi:MAG: hypothetical protein ACKOTB_18050, partial [Planctomycetia bacterium]
MQSKRAVVVPDWHSAADPATVGIRVPFVRPVLPTLAELQPAFERIVAGGRLTKGPYDERLELAIAEHRGVRHAVAV